MNIKMLINFTVFTLFAVNVWAASMTSDLARVQLEMENLYDQDGSLYAENYIRRKIYFQTFSFAKEYENLQVDLAKCEDSECKNQKYKRQLDILDEIYRQHLTSLTDVAVFQTTIASNEEAILKKCTYRAFYLVKKLDSDCIAKENQELVSFLEESLRRSFDRVISAAQNDRSYGCIKKLFQEFLNYNEMQSIERAARCAKSFNTYDKLAFEKLCTKDGKDYSEGFKNRNNSSSKENFGDHVEWLLHGSECMYK